ncbi:MAG: toxin-antitoxin system HicB family antitoxin [Pirellulales bacterium]|nr:toxin-antitoxin system HicB family antitoxin [Pirellulales bacterium]
MITCEKKAEVKRVSEDLLAQGPDWVTFYREILGLHGVARHAFPTREAFAAFEQSEDNKDILQMLAKLRRQGPVAMDENEPTRVITVRMPKSLHEALREEAHDHRTSMNKLCISKLLQFIDGESVPADTEPS